MEKKLFFISMIMLFTISSFLKAQKIDVYSEKGKYGLIVNQKKVTEPIYDVIYKFKNNIAKVAQHGTWRKTESDNNSLIFPLINLEHKKEQYEGGKYGAIDINGKIVIPLEYSYIGNFENNRARAYKDGKLGIINSEGEVIIPIEYTNIGNFENNRARAYKNGKLGIINSEGEVIVPVEYNYIGKFHNGRAKAQRNNKMVFIDEKGNEVK